MTTEYPTLTVLGNKVLEPQRRLECFPNPHKDIQDLTVVCETDEFTCCCPVTGQPDFAKVRIEYRPSDWVVESKSLKLYLWSYREERAFHEDLTGQIAKYFMDTVRPSYVRVTLIFNPRGGIAITSTANLTDYQYFGDPNVS